MRICLIASSRFPIAEPFAGGLESMTHVLASELVRRGHDVTLFAADGSDPRLPVEFFTPARVELSAAALADAHAPSRGWIEEHHAYLALMLQLARAGRQRFDVVHNNSLHHLPVAMAGMVDVPTLTTLHTPPLPLVESAIQVDTSSSFAAVSSFTAAAWSHAVPSRVIHNGIDLDRWRFGPGGGSAVWSGRLVPEKAPHMAIDACRRAGIPVLLVGPAHDPDYFAAQIQPRLGLGAEYRGHLGQSEIGHLLRNASVAVVTPEWDEPYGLVASEAMASGTPVAGYARGALREVVGAEGGVLVPPGDVEALAAAIARARRLDRMSVRRHAEITCSLDLMVDAYEHYYALLAGSAVAA